MQIKLSFLGAAQNVTGSRYLLEANGTRILIDCGLYQERHFQERNWDPFPLPPKQIDAVLLTHAHLDHCGLLPKLVKEGFSGQIYCTAGTAEIAEIILLDSGHIQEEDAAYKARRHQKEGRKGKFPVRPLYNIADAERAIPHFHPVEYKQVVKLGEGLEATFHDAGHVLGSSMITVRASLNGESRTILFSGDVGRTNMPILDDPTIFERADYVLTESTYGDRVHEPVADVKTRLAEVVNTTIDAGGNLVIPSFALERSQDLLYHLNDLRLAKRIPEVKVYLDSPMAIKVTKVFSEHPEYFDKDMAERVNNHHSPFDFPGLEMTRTTDESKAINFRSEPCIIIAGSGMCTGGRIKHHLANNISKEANTILFVGYQANGTLGRIIIDGKDSIRILGQPRKIRARIEQIGGFSAHADCEELTKWLSGLKQAPRKVFVVHGEASAAAAFGKYLVDKTGWNVHVPEYQETVELD